MRHADDGHVHASCHHGTMNTQPWINLNQRINAIAATADIRHADEHNVANWLKRRYEFSAREMIDNAMEALNVDDAIASIHAIRIAFMLHFHGSAHTVDRDMMSTMRSADEVIMSMDIDNVVHDIIQGLPDDFIMETERHWITPHWEQ